MDLSHLNPQQTSAVKLYGKPLLVFAGAGSGKTRVIVNKIAYLIEEKKLPPRNILALTFTKKAAEEMKERIKTIIPSNLSGMFIGTFHAWGAYILRRESELLGYTNSFTIYDSRDKETIIKDILKQLNIGNISTIGISSLISKLKSSMISAEEYSNTPKDKKQEEILAFIYKEYEKIKSQSNAVDFDDLLILPLKLFSKYDDLKEKYRSVYKYVLVDEYQDTNRIQYLLVKSISGDQICVVGDDDQAIYSWRGADVTNILQFQKDFPNAEVIKLSVNYRSTQNIIDAAYQVVQNNQIREDKDISSNKGGGENVYIYEADDDDDEASHCIYRIQDLVEKGYKYSDISVLYRTNAQSRRIEELLVENNIPYTLVGGVRFYERMEIKDLVSYVLFLLPNNDDIPLLRIINTPSRAIGNAKIELMKTLSNDNGCTIKQIVKAYCKQSGIKFSNWENNSENIILSEETVKQLNFLTPFVELIRNINEIKSNTLKDLVEVVLEQTKYKDYLQHKFFDTYEERVENIIQLKQLTQLYTSDIKGITQFNEDITLMTDIDNIDNANKISLLTLHASKGLEFPIVQIIGVNEGILPHFRSIDNHSNLEEERRLMYVGMTRAQEKLYISYVRYSYTFQKTLSPSRFLSEISENLIEFE